MEKSELISQDTNDLILSETNKESTNRILPQSFPETELREIEQYFFSDNVLENIVSSLYYEDDIVCLCTPAVADAFYRFKEKEVICLDLDKRFSYLPLYQYYDLLKPLEIEIKPNIIIIDPPFFKINLVDLYNCVECLTKCDKSTKIIIAYVHREERALLSIFKSYGLKLTKFKLEYRNVESSKWNNYALYANFECNKIKFYDKKKKIGK
jgi:hypothetical protein